MAGGPNGGRLLSQCKIGIFLENARYPCILGFGGELGGQMGRIWGLAALAVAVWLLAVYAQSRPAPLGLDAPATQFSAARADAVLGGLLGDQQPRPAPMPPFANGC
jgi:hypothetical protein